MHLDLETFSPGPLEQKTATSQVNDDGSAIPNPNYDVARFRPATRAHEGILCIHAFKLMGMHRDRSRPCLRRKAPCRVPSRMQGAN